MTSILMGTETVDQYGKHHVLVVPTVAVFNPCMSDSLISASRLMDVDYNVMFRIPQNAASDGFSPKDFPQYGRSVKTPDGLSVIVMEYVSHTWRPPKPGTSKVKLARILIRFACPIPSALKTLGTNFEVFVPNSLSTQNSFSALSNEFDNSEEVYVPDFLSPECVSRTPATALRIHDNIISMTATSPPASVAEEDVETETAPSPPGTDLRMDWVDTCSLG